MRHRSDLLRAIALRSLAVIAATAGFGIAAGAAIAAGESAVSQPHAVLRVGADFFGIGSADRQVFTAGGTYYWPVADEVGVAGGVDLGFASGDGDVNEALGVRGAAFWRRPSTGYGGGLVRYRRVGDFDRVDVRAIGGLYFDELELLGSTGFDGGDGDDLGLVEIEVGWYATPQLRLGAALEAGSGPTAAGVADLYFQPSREAPVALRVYAGGGEFDDRGYYTAGLGVVVSFATTKPLLRQLREDRILAFD